jgi:hypothetical protein
MKDIFFNGKGVVHHEFVPRGQTINGEFFLEVMKRRREAKQRKRLVERRNTSMQHHYNAPTYTSFLAPEFLAKHRTIVARQQP